MTKPEKRRFTKTKLPEGQSIGALVKAGREYFTHGANGEGTLELLPDGQYLVCVRRREKRRWEKRAKLGWETQYVFPIYHHAIGFLNRTVYQL